MLFLSAAQESCQIKQQHIDFSLVETLPGDWQLWDAVRGVCVSPIRSNRGSLFARQLYSLFTLPLPLASLFSHAWFSLPLQFAYLWWALCNQGLFSCWRRNKSESLNLRCVTFPHQSKCTMAKKNQYSKPQPLKKQKTSKVKLLGEI